MIKLGILVAIFLLSWSNNLLADIVQYTFAGQIPVGATNTHSEIDIGEFWEANFFVDTSTPADDPDNTEYGLYMGAVINGSLSFSGGYTSPFDFASADVRVINDLDGGTNVVDIFAVQSLSNVFQFFTTDLSTLPSSSLPGAGTSGSPILPTLPFGIFQLSYSDSNGLVLYDVRLANNTEFSASAVPEPTLTILLGVCLIGSWMRRRR